MEFIAELWKYVKQRKKFWLLPIIIVLLFLGILLVIGGSTAISPFIYSIF
jgi:competence protein ComGC